MTDYFGYIFDFKANSQIKGVKTVMCQHCKRFGTTLVSYPWPSEPVVIEPVPPMSQDMANLFVCWSQLQGGLQQAMSVGVPAAAAIHSASHYPAHSSIATNSSSSAACTSRGLNMPTGLGGSKNDITKLSAKSGDLIPLLLICFFPSN